MLKLSVDPEFAKSLHFQCARENLEEVEALLKSGADPNEVYVVPDEVADAFLKDEFNGLDARIYANKSAAIHIAMDTKNLKLLKLLTEYGADVQLEPDGRVENGRETPVEIAIRTGFLEGLKYIREERGETLSRYGSLDFRLAVNAIDMDGTLETFLYVLESQGFTLADLSSNRKANLMRAAEKTDIPLFFADYLLENGINVNEEAPLVEEGIQSWRDGGKWEPRALENYDLSRLHECLAYLDTLYDTLPIIRAAYHGNLDHVNLYLKYGADPVRRDRYNNTAFDAASDARARIVSPAHQAITNIMKDMLKGKGTIVPFPKPKPPLTASLNNPEGPKQG